MCWHCWECRPRLRRKWIGHATRVWQSCNLHLGAVIVNMEAWPSFSRKLRKYGLNHFKVRLGTAQYGVIVGARANLDDLPFAINPITLKDAIKRFAGWVNSVQDGRGGNPVSSSRSWALPAQMPSGWQKIAVGPTTAQVRELAAATGVHFAERFIAGVEMTVCSGDTDSMDALCTALAELSPNFHPIKDGCEFKSDSDSIREGADNSRRNDPYFSSLCGPSNIELAT